MKRSYLDRDPPLTIEGHNMEVWQNICILPIKGVISASRTPDPF